MTEAEKNTQAQEQEQKQENKTNAPYPRIKITVRDMGTMTAELYPDKAPATVENFLSLIRKGFFSV